MLPFERATTCSLVNIDNTRLLRALTQSGDAFSLFISLGNKFETIRETEDGATTIREEVARNCVWCLPITVPENPRDLHRITFICRDGKALALG